MRTFKNIQEKIEFLRDCAKKYETNGTSPISDDEWDTLRQEVVEECPDCEFLSLVGGIDESHVYGTKVAHKYVMGSLNKDPDPEEFGKWLSKTFDNLDEIVALLQLKVDGSSFCLKYQDSEFIQGVTRGDGITGLDFTNNAKYIGGVKKSIDAKGYIEIKGEVYKNKQNFFKQKWNDEYANPRNFTAGAINQKDPLVTKERELDFIAYEVRGVNFKTEEEKQKFLIDNGFKTLKEHTIKINCKGKTVDEIVNEVKRFMESIDRDNLPFDIDGVVWKVNNIEFAESMGTTDGGKRPKSNRAIKFPTEKKITMLNDIEWNIGRTGTLTPVGILEPVQLAGTTVSRVTLHNLKEMERLGINKTGCMVEVAKQGDIIPKVQRMTREGNKKIVIPDLCPACEEELGWDDTNTTKHCTNESCPAQINRSIEHWFKTLGVLGIGQGIIEKLTMEKNSYDGNMVGCISDMYGLAHFKAELSEKFGNKAFANILEAIDSVKEVPLALFIESLGIGKIGSMSKEITAIAPTVKDIDELTVEDVVQIHGFKDKKAQSFINGWKKQRKEIEKLLKHIIIKEKVMASKKLEGKSFCITGTLSQKRDDIVALIENNGGKFASGVSKNLDYLIAGEDCGSKLDKANKLGVKVLSEKDFDKMLK